MAKNKCDISYRAAHTRMWKQFFPQKVWQTQIKWHEKTISIWAFMLGREIVIGNTSKCERSTNVDIHIDRKCYSDLTTVHDFQ